MWIFRFKQLLWLLLIAGIFVMISMGVYQDMQRYRYEEVLQPLAEIEEQPFSEKELLHVLLNAYYMNLSMAELRAELMELTGNESFVDALEQEIIKVGGGEEYIRRLCDAMNAEPAAE